MAPDTWGVASWGGTTYKLYNSSASCTTATDWPEYSTWDSERIMFREVIPDKLPAGKRTLELPDGAKLIVDHAGNYRIDDADAKVTYQANRIREFSPHLNASDMLAKFVDYVRTVGVKRQDVLELPIKLFVSWLVIEAAERDGDEIPAGIVPVEKDRAVSLLLRPRCLACGRFVPKRHARHGFPYCSPEHAGRHIAIAG